MKFAVMGDIHGNLEAFKVVLNDAKEQGCTLFAILGDLVGYCADPKPCLDIVRAMKVVCVKGNFDEYCATESPLHGFTPRAAQMLQWTRKQLNDDDRKWLHNLPYVLSVDDFTIVHASLEQPEAWGYVFETAAAAASMAHQRTSICFFGHTHVPIAFIRDNVVRGATYTKFKTEHGKHYFVNPGSVGQPRDGDPKASYLIYDKNERTIELRRLAYDNATTRRKMRDAGLDG